MTDAERHAAFRRGWKEHDAEQGIEQPAPETTKAKECDGNECKGL
jgi:hypothetical protein